MTLDASGSIVVVSIAVLIAGFGFAAVADVRSREVTDRLWQVLGGAGLVLGGVLLASAGALALALWVLVGLLTLQHMFSWDLRLGTWVEAHADLVELVGYVVVVAVVATAVARVGVGSDAVPFSVIAVLATVLVARGLFEAGLLYGGADAKALMIAGLLLPTFETPLLVGTSALAAVYAILPFALTLLMDAAILSVVVPVGLAARNASRRDFPGLRGFTGYSIPARELPDRWVWVRDPAVEDAREREEEAETSADDRRLRTEIARDLERRGIARVWVTPQLPFLAVMFAGLLVALAAGNLVLDLFAAL